MRLLSCIWVLVAVFILAACEAKTTQKIDPSIAGPAVSEQAPRDLPGIHNVVAYHEDFYSGSAPEGVAGFGTLADIGVKTIISVDGAVPDVEAARALGMRYIHLPIGYDGIDEERKLDLVRATRDAMRDGPVYIHCHHGKHRSAGAAGAIAVSLGWSSPNEMVERMKVSGTSPSYTGLYGCTVAAVTLPSDVIDSVDPVFPEVSMPAGLVKAMVEIDEINERLKLIARAQWRVPADHPDLVAIAEAGRMADILRLLGDDERVKSEPAEFIESMRAHAEEAAALEHMLDSPTPDAARLSAHFELMQASCKDCHRRFRD